MSDRLSDDENCAIVESSVVLFDKLKWMTSQEAARYLRMSRSYLRVVVARGDLKSYQVNNRLRFLRSDLDRLVKPRF